MRIAFHPALKAPDHPVPSGDRQMARLLIAALRARGHAVSVPSGLRSFARSPDAGALAGMEAAAAVETGRLLAHWQGEGWREKPDLWFTYHLYYKAPDLIGPALSRALRIPYLAAEASHAPKRSQGPWAAWQAHVETALAACEVIFCFTKVDRDGLQQLPWLTAKLVDLPPFIDAARTANPLVRPRAAASKPGGLRSARLITIAMMRADVKLQSYRFLAQALALLPPGSWHLDIAGDGPARADVEAAFRSLQRQNITFHGLAGPEDISALLAGADIFLWPGFAEAYGLVYLEAQAAGLPVVALDCGGVASTLRPGITGLLVSEPTPEAYAAAIGKMMDDPQVSRQMGAAAQEFVLTERNLTRASAILDDGLLAARERMQR